MRLWVTRTEPGASRTAAAIGDLGHEAVVQPVLDAEPLAGLSVDMTGVGALAFTSAQGVFAFAGLGVGRELPVHVTGRGTAQAALECGFTDIHSADGDAADLASLILSLGSGGTVLWPCAEEPARDLAGLLLSGGVACRSLPVYRTVAVGAPAPPDLDGVVVHSAKAAHAVAGVLPHEAALEMTLYALSEQAASPLVSWSFARVAIASEPQESALLALIAG